MSPIVFLVIGVIVLVAFILGIVFGANIAGVRRLRAAEARAESPMLTELGELRRQVEGITAKLDGPAPAFASVPTAGYGMRTIGGTSR